jgi:hypothetical protein
MVFENTPDTPQFNRMRIQTKVPPYESYQPNNTNAQRQINREFEPEDDLFDLRNNVINGFSHSAFSATAVVH